MRVAPQVPDSRPPPIHGGGGTALPKGLCITLRGRSARLGSPARPRRFICNGGRRFPKSLRNAWVEGCRPWKRSPSADCPSLPPGSVLVHGPSGVGCGAAAMPTTPSGQFRPRSIEASRSSTPRRSMDSAARKSWSGRRCPAAGDATVRSSRRNAVWSGPTGASRETRARGASGRNWRTRCVGCARIGSTSTRFTGPTPPSRLPRPRLRSGSCCTRARSVRSG